MSCMSKPPMKEVKGHKDPKEWYMDPKGYFLIDPRPEEGLIYAHHYTKEKEYTQSISGKTAEEVYYTILRLDFVSLLMHAAYLGSELQKAEILIRTKKGKYIQCDPLQLEE